MKKTNIFKTAALSTGLMISGGVVNELIINGQDWEPINNQSEKVRKLSESQVQITLSNNLRCTGSMITPKILFTNNHCVPNSGITAKIDGNVLCDELLHTSEKHDYSLVLCPDADFTPLEFDVNPVLKGDKIYALHSNCNYYENPFCKVEKLYSAGTVLEVNELFLKHDDDTLGGSSGAPILRDGKIVALHYGGVGNTNHDGHGLYNLSKTARGILLDMPSIYRDQMSIKGNMMLPQNNSAPFVPAGSKVKMKWVKIKPSLWQKFKCLFKRGC